MMSFLYDAGASNQAGQTGDLVLVRCVQGARMNLYASEIKAFAPAADFERSKQFYLALGCEIPWSSAELAYVRTVKRASCCKRSTTLTSS